VYVIDQDDAVRDSLTAVIESNGFRVQDFSTKEEFLLDTEPNAGNCLVLGFSRYGAEAIESLRALGDRRPDLPIVFVVGQGGTSSGASDRGRAFAQLSRPIQEATLIQTIQSAVER
jgi:FixJ family two-component response regulator